MRLNFIATRKRDDLGYLVEEYRFAGIPATMRLTEGLRGRWHFDLLSFPNRCAAVGELFAKAQILSEYYQRKH
jgi:hypothetical protein